MKKWHWLTLALLVALTIVAQYLGHESHHWWDRVPAFWALFGSAGGLIILALATTLSKVFGREEDYYDEP